MGKLYYISSQERIQPAKYQDGSYIFVPYLNEDSAELWQMMKRGPRVQWVMKGFVHRLSVFNYAGLSKTTNTMLMSREVELTDALVDELLKACHPTPRPARLYVMACIPLNMSRFIVGDHILVTAGNSLHCASLIECVANKPPMEGVRVKCVARISKESSLWAENEQIAELMQQPSATNPQKEPFYIEGQPREQLLNALLDMPMGISPFSNYPQFLSGPSSLIGQVVPIDQQPSGPTL